MNTMVEQNFYADRNMYTTMSAASTSTHSSNSRRRSPEDFFNDEAMLDKLIESAYNNTAHGSEEAHKECLFTAFVSAAIEYGFPEPDESAIAEYAAAAEACGLRPEGSLSLWEFSYETKAIFSKVAERREMASASRLRPPQ